MTAFRSLPTVLLDRLTQNSTIDDWPEAVPHDIADRRKGLDHRMRKAAGIDIAECLVIDARDVSLHSRKRSVLHLRFAYDQEFSKSIKQTVPEAVYSKATNGWKVPCDTMDDDTAITIADLLCSRFATIMIHEPRILLKPTDPATGKTPMPFAPPVADVGFVALPFDLNVERSRIETALADAGHADVRHLNYDDGTELVPWIQETIHTRMPFLLVRFSSGGKPRYAEYSTLSEMVLSTRYHGEKDTSTMIARNRHAILATGLPVVTQDDAVVHETWELRMRARRIDPAFDTACASLHARGVLPTMVGLVNPEHLTVTRRKAGAATHHHGIEAYVELRSIEHVTRVMRRLAPHLEQGASPIAVTPQFLATRNGPDGPFLRILAHETAHVVETDRARRLGRTTTGHGIGWRVHDAIIAASMGVSDQPSAGLLEYLDENGLGHDVAEAVEIVLKDLPPTTTTEKWTYEDTERLVSRKLSECMDIVDHGDHPTPRLPDEMRLVDECDVLESTFRVNIHPETADRLRSGGIVMASQSTDCPCAGVAAGMYMNGSKKAHLVLAISADDQGYVHYAALYEDGSVNWWMTNGNVDENRLDFFKKVMLKVKPDRIESLPLVDGILIEQSRINAMEIDSMGIDELDVKRHLNRLCVMQMEVIGDYVERCGRVVNIVHDDLKKALATPRPSIRH